MFVCSVAARLSRMNPSRTSRNSLRAMLDGLTTSSSDTGLSMWVMNLPLSHRQNVNQELSVRPWMPFMAAPTPSMWWISLAALMPSPTPAPISLYSLACSYTSTAMGGRDLPFLLGS